MASALNFIRRTLPTLTRAGEPVDRHYGSSLLDLTGSTAEETVSVDRALGLDAVWAAVRLIAETGGSLPLRTYRETASQRFEVDDHPAPLLSRAPNRESSAVEVWSQVLAHLTLWGNAFVGIERRGNSIIGLWPIEPSRVRVTRDRGLRRFEHSREDGTRRTYSEAEVIHVRGLSLDGLTGMSPISYERETIGTGLAQQRHAGELVANKATPSGVLELPEGQTMAPDMLERLAAQWKRLYGRRGSNAGGTAILEGGVKFKPVSLPPEDLEFVAQRKLTVQAIARIFNIPPELLGGESGGSMTYSNVAAQARQFLTYGLSPWLERIEGALNRHPALGLASAGLRCEFDTQRLLRADTKTRYETYKIALDAGFVSREEVREWEGMGPMRGDVYVA